MLAQDKLSLMIPAEDPEALEHNAEVTAQHNFLINEIIKYSKSKFYVHGQWELLRAVSHLGVQDRDPCRGHLLLHPLKQIFQELLSWMELSLTSTAFLYLILVKFVKIKLI